MCIYIYIYVYTYINISEVNPIEFRQLLVQTTGINNKAKVSQQSGCF